MNIRKTLILSVFLTVRLSHAFSADPGAMAPAWKLKDLDGNEVTNADFKGKVVMIDFWATWCPPCRAMIPGMVELQEEYLDKGFMIVGISLDEKGPGVVREFNKEFKVNYTSLLGDEAVVRTFGGIRVIPTSFIINREGRIVSTHVGYVTKEKLESEIKPLL
jgi:thiol-disulfide isomerase/thioredoxin